MKYINTILYLTKEMNHKGREDVLSRTVKKNIKIIVIVSCRIFLNYIYQIYNYVL